MARLLFVCAGNICRSPLAEGIFLHKIQQKNLSRLFEVDSAGTGAWHVGERPDVRSQKVAREHGISLPGHSRQFIKNDFNNFDLILAMDASNYQDILRMAPEGERYKVKLMRDYDLPEFKGQSVPDPYYGGPDGFELMFEMLERSCENLLNELVYQSQEQ